MRRRRNNGDFPDLRLQRRFPSNRGNDPVKPGFQRLKTRRQHGDDVRRAFVFPDIEQDAAVSRRRLARTPQERGGLRRLSGGEQMHLNRPSGGNLPAAEDPDAVSAEQFQ
jgi:hypothetical protein